MWAKLQSVAIAALVSSAAWAGTIEAPKSGIAPLAQDASFEHVWVVDRNSPELYEVLAALTAPGRFDAVVLSSSSNGENPRAAVFNHLLEILPAGVSHWVSHQPVPVGLNVDGISAPADLAADQLQESVVLCAEDELMPLAALIAMRMDAALIHRLPDSPVASTVQVGGSELNPEHLVGTAYQYLETEAEAVAFANRLATRSAILVYAQGGLLPEHVLYAFQRGVLVLPVVPPPYSGDDLESELHATVATAAQIRAAVAVMHQLDGALPEALVIAGDWNQIPYRFARSIGGEWVDCDFCDNGVRTYAADTEYGNFDGDPWGEPEVASGRLMSYDRDLLAVQSVIGLWRDLGAFEEAPRATFLGLFASPLRDTVLLGWQAEHWDRQWQMFGPETAAEYASFDLDEGDFLNTVDASDVVLFHGHGAPDYLGHVRELLNGEILASTAATARPAFWFVSACATARQVSADSPYGSPQGDGNLVSALQARLVLGAMMSVEVTSGSSGHPVWWTSVLDREIAVGELLRRSTAAAASAYRGGSDAPQVPPGLAARRGTENDLKNAWTTSMWVGDPLTVF